jgi:hypothetical protein
MRRKYDNYGNHQLINQIIMKTLHSNRLLKASLLVLCGSFVFLASSALATLVTWDLNPGGSNVAVGSSTESYLESGYTISASGYDFNSSGPGTAHELLFKDAGTDEVGLGLVGTLNNELQVDGSGNPLQFIQLNLTSILSKGFTGGKIEIGSVQSGESFFLYGSNTLGVLGTKLDSTPFTSSVDDQFISVPSFGTYKFISVVSAVDDVLPVAFQASVVPVPEAASLVPAALAVVVAIAFEARRRRRRPMAQ